MEPLDAGNFQALQKAHADRIYSYAYYLLRNHEDAEDVVQEVFIRLWRRCPAGDDRGRAAWMTRVARNLCIDVQRRRAARRDRPLDEPLAARLAAARSPAADPELCLQLDQTQRLLLDALARLPETTRDIMLMHYFQGLAYGEISALLGIGESTIKVKVHRARRRLRGLLAAEALEAEAGSVAAGGSVETGGSAAAAAEGGG